MNKRKKLAKVGVKVGKAILSMAEAVLVELMEQAEDLNYMRYHSYAVLGRDVRSARSESEEGRRLHELKMKRQAIDRLRRQKFIKMRHEGERVICELTKNGRAKAIQASILANGSYFHDKRLCLVSFDFPEAARQARNAFRKTLKDSGFTFVQGSVWSIKKDVAYRLNELIDLLKLQRWVCVYTVI